MSYCSNATTLFLLACSTLFQLPDAAMAETQLRGDPVPTITVGSGAGCDYSDLQTAINAAADNSELRLENETFVGNFDIFGKSLVVRGGYETCSDSTPGFSSTLDANGSGRPLHIGQSSSPSDVRLFDINLTGGSTSANQDGGGLLVDASDAEHEVRLTDVNIDGNASGDDGGGIAVIGASNTRLSILGSSVIQSNSATMGGGIYCLGVGGRPLITFPEGAMFSNESVNQGGGMALDDCRAYLNAGGLLQGVFNNIAGSVGGGIAVMDASLLIIQGSTSTPASVVGNSVGGVGGGIWAGDDAVVEVMNASISSNSADSDGGGFFLRGNASLTMRQASPGACQAADCSEISNNSARSGGAIYIADAGASAVIRQTRIYGNSNQTDSEGSVGSVNEGSLVLESDFIYGNSGTQLFRVTNGGQLEVAWSTIADNSPISGSPELIRLRADDTTVPKVSLHATIIQDTGRDVLDINTTFGSDYALSLDCLISHELGSLPGATRSQVENPLFVDAATDNYHIQPGSPAIDFCDDVNAPIGTDIDGDERGNSVGAIGQTPYDIGADEVLIGIFSDRFEQ